MTRLAVAAVLLGVGGVAGIAVAVANPRPAAADSSGGGVAMTDLIPVGGSSVTSGVLVGDEQEHRVFFNRTAGPLLLTVHVQVDGTDRMSPTVKFGPAARLDDLGAQSAMLTGVLRPDDPLIVFPGKVKTTWTILSVKAGNSSLVAR